MVTVPAGSTLLLRCPGAEPLALITLAEVSAAFVAELPPIPVLGPDGPGTRRFGILELVSSAGVTWVEAELRDGTLTFTGRVDRGPTAQGRMTPSRTRGDLDQPEDPGSR